MSAETNCERSEVSIMPTASELAAEGMLTERQAEIWSLCEIEGVSQDRAAELLGIAPSTVGSHLSTARDRVESIKATAELIESAERSREQRIEISD
jgi:DNA-directed RNA polymerase specialized sigma24 family protein